MAAFRASIHSDCAVPTHFGHRSDGPKNCPNISRIAVRIKSDQCPNWIGLLSELDWIACPNCPGIRTKVVFNAETLRRERILLFLIDFLVLHCRGARESCYF